MKPFLGNFCSSRVERDREIFCELYIVPDHFLGPEVSYFSNNKILSPLRISFETR